MVFRPGEPRGGAAGDLLVSGQGLRDYRVRFVGSAQLYFGGVVLAYSILAIVMGVVYAYMTWARMMQRPRWVAMASLYIPALVVVLDVLLTAVSTIYSLMIVSASVLLIFYSYSEYRDMKMMPK